MSNKVRLSHSPRAMFVEPHRNMRSLDMPEYMVALTMQHSNVSAYPVPLGLVS